MSNPLLDVVHEILDLEGAKALLGWDQDTHMPPGGAEGRARAQATLEKETHRRICDPRLGDLAREALNATDPIQQEIGRYWLKSHEEAIKVPSELAGALAETASISTSAWHHATTFGEMVPHLDKLVRLNRDYAACFPEQNPYDALIDGFDPDLTQAGIDKVFDVLRPALLDLRQRASGQTAAPHATTAEKQALLQLCRDVTETLGYDYKRGNLALTEHPFMIGLNIDDVRIATNLKLDDPLHTLTGAVHEAGHAIYEQGAGYADTGLGTLASSALHESQSLFYEVMLGKSLPFWHRWLPRLNSILSVPFPSPEAVVAELRRYDPSNVVRLKAGDLDYGLHIMLRYDIERELFSSKIEAKDMRDRFNELCLSYFGREPADDRREGVLQDVHWPAGLFGYFPSYLLGISFSADLWDRCPDKEDLASILAFLRLTVHQHGGRYSFEELTAGYDPMKYIHYLRQAYGL